MKKLILALIFSLYASPLYAATITDNFTGTDTDLGTNWDSGYYGAIQNCQRVNDRARPGVAGTTCFESWNADSFSGDQTAEVVLTTFQGSDTSLSLLLKASAPETATTFYRCRINTIGDVQLRKVVAESSTTLNQTTGVTFSEGDTFKCTLESGGNLTIYKNGISVLTASDSSNQLTGDRIGISIYNFTDGDIELDDFSGGDIAAPAPSGNKAQVVVIE